ncbi:MAG: radical SAM protein [Magnetococcus sp. MYC-9]
METISCQYLQRAIYFAPDELRHCCKRFFVQGALRGDVRICSVAPGEELSPARVIREKQAMIDRINAGVQTDCTGCPFLEKRQWSAVAEERFDTLSIEHHSKCNMRCQYCSDTYHGDKSANYDLIAFLRRLVAEERIAGDLRVAWGGGEPTLLENFSELLDCVADELKPKGQRFFSNAINFSEPIARLLETDRAELVTSVDAGSVETFRKVRGVNQYRKVLTHLKRYFDRAPRNVLIKYILTEDNHSIAEITGFVRDIQHEGLAGASFLVSTNFKEEDVSPERGLAILYLRHLLTQAGAHTCTFDDHICFRTGQMAARLVEVNVDADTPPAVLQFIQSYAERQGEDLQDVVIWGTGEYAEFLLENAPSLRKYRVRYFVDSDPKKQNREFHGAPVYPPQAITQDDASILIASGLFYKEIVDTILGLGVGRERILSNILI